MRVVVKLLSPGIVLWNMNMTAEKTCLHVWPEQSHFDRPLEEDLKYPLSNLSFERLELFQKGDVQNP